MLAIAYQFEDLFTGSGSLNNFPNWSAESGVPGWTLHTGYISNDDVGGTAISNRSIGGANPENSRTLEVEFTLPPDDTAAFSFSITIGSIWTGVVSREAGVGKFVRVDIFTPPGVGALSSVSGGTARHVLRLVYDGFLNEAYLDDEHVVHYVDTSASNTLSNIQLESDDLSGIKIYRMTGVFYMADTFAIAAAPHLVLDNSGGDYEDTADPIAWVDPGNGTLELWTFDYIANEIQKINLSTGARTTKFTLGAGCPDVLSAIADHPLGLLISGIGTFGNYLIDKTTGDILGSGQAYWPRAANHADFGGILYDATSGKIIEFTQCTTGHNDVLRVYSTPALTNNGAAITPDQSYSPLAQGIAANISAIGTEYLVADQNVTSAGTLVPLISSGGTLAAGGLSTLIGTTGSTAYGLAVRPTDSLIEVLGFTTGSAGGTLTQHWRTSRNDTIPDGGNILGGTVGTVTIAGATTFNNSQAALTYTGMNVTNNGVLTLSVPLTTGVISNAGTVLLSGIVTSGGTITGGHATNTGTITGGVIANCITTNTTHTITGGTLSNGSVSGGSVTSGIVNAALSGVLWSGGTCTSACQLNGSTMTGGVISGTLVCNGLGTITTTSAVTVSGSIVVGGTLTINKGASSYTDTGCTYKTFGAGKILFTGGIVPTGSMVNQPRNTGSAAMFFRR